MNDENVKAQLMCTLQILVLLVIIFFQIRILRLYFTITKYLPDTDEY